MVIVVVWNTYSPKEEPVMAAGYNEENAWWNHPLTRAVEQDEHSQYHIGIIRPESCNGPTR